MSKKGVTYRLVILILLIVAVCFCIVMAMKLKGNQEKMNLLETRIEGYRNAEKEPENLKVQLEEGQHYGDYQGNDDFSEIIHANPIDQDYQQELKQLQEKHVTTTLEWGAFEGRYLAVWEKEMNATLEHLYPLLGEEDRVNLEQSQKNWQTYMDADYAFVLDKFILTRDFGTQGSVNLLAAQSRQTKERTIKLMEYLFSIDREAVDFVYDHEERDEQSDL